MLRSACPEGKRSQQTRSIGARQREQAKIKSWSRQKADPSFGRFYRQQLGGLATFRFCGAKERSRTPNLGMLVDSCAANCRRLTKLALSPKAVVPAKSTRTKGAVLIEKCARSEMRENHTVFIT
jgi:hypothetical protein